PHGRCALSLHDALPISEFQEDGQFSAERYNQLLAAAGLSPRDFEQGQRGELALQRVLGPVSASAAVPTSIRERVQAALTESRTVRLRTFPIDRKSTRLNFSHVKIS